MSISREWNSLKAAWIIMLLFLTVRIFLSSHFLLTPEEAVYWQTSQNPLTGGDDNSPILTLAMWMSTSLFGNNELAVRLPAILGLTLTTIYMARLAASMFSWHTALHVTLLGHGILQLNMAALVVTPYSLLLPCWSAVIYYSSQAMYDNRTGQWLSAGFWFGIGLLCNLSMILLLPCLILCLILIKPFRTCLLYAGPWFGFLMALSIFIAATIWLEMTSVLSIIDKANLKNISVYLIPDPSYSLQFFIDQMVLITPVVLLLILAGWLTGSNKRHLVKPDVHFLILTSFPLFLLYLIFPVFAANGPAWSSIAYISAIVLIAGLHSSTRSSFKGRPNHRWILGVTSAYCVTIPLIIQFTYPAALPLPVNMSQTRLAASGWDLLGKEVNQSFHLMPDRDKTFIFSMEQRLAAELAFYVPGNPKILSLNQTTHSNRKYLLDNKLQLTGQNGLGLVSTQDAVKQAGLLFDRVELEKEISLKDTTQGSTGQNQTFYIIRGFGLKKL